MVFFNIYCIFNRVWESSGLPESWETSAIVPILKPVKDAGVAAGYRLNPHQLSLEVN